MLRDRTLRLAVTGLSGSGKTAFITSLVHNLLSAVRHPVRLPFFRAASECRILVVGLEPTGGDGRSVSDSRRDCSTRSRPAPLAGTTDLRRADLSLHFTPAGFLGRAAGGAAELHLEILDYPGEWLLDLPLLGQTYREWSRTTLEQARCGARAPLARDWLDFLARHPAQSAGDAEAAQRAHLLASQLSRRCRTRNS